MTSFEYMERLQETLQRKGIMALSIDQLAEIEDITASAMQDAWERGQEFDRGIQFSNDRI